jgi:hypothetical protein
MERDVNYLQVVNSGNGFNSDQKQNLDGFNYNWHFKTDYSQKIFNNGKLETGIDIKNQLRHSYSDGANKVGIAYFDAPAIYNNKIMTNKLCSLSNVWFKNNRFS